MRGPLSSLPLVLLASASPRRASLLCDLRVRFIQVPANIDEAEAIKGVDPRRRAEVLAFEKARSVAIPEGLSEYPLVLAADTVVLLGGEQFNKPTGRDEAVKTLSRLSGREHQVITGVSFRYKGKELDSYSCETRVRFAPMSQSEIAYYVDTYAPYDKAGSYGIQEWVGMACIEGISGSYTNVMGLPTQAVWSSLVAFVRQGLASCKV